MSLAKKLQRLPPLSRTPTDAVSADEATRGPVGQRDAASAPSIQDGRPSLDQLRDRIAALLSRGDPKPEAPARDQRAETSLSFSELPFSRVESDHGTLDLCRRSVPPGYRVGSIPTYPARCAQSAILALLALDPTLSGCDLRRALYVDTETTGLAGGTGTVAFLVGLGFFDEQRDGFVIEQLMLRDLGDEAPMLEHIARRVEEASCLVSFNGKSFDLPLLRTRTVMARSSALVDRPHLDLLHVARRLHKHRLASCSLQSLEAELFGQVRVGDVSGADIAAIYHHYLRSRDASGLMPIVSHNWLDVASMFSLVGLYGEPLEVWETGSSLRACDVAAASAVAKRGGQLEVASRLADASVARESTPFGHRARGDVARARGDRAHALLHYEAALDAALAEAPKRRSKPRPPQDQAGEVVIKEAPQGMSERDTDRLRVELAKLYEHHAQQYQKAIAVLAEASTGGPERYEARLGRLGRKVSRALAEQAEGPAPTNKRKRRKPPVLP